MAELSMTPQRRRRAARRLAALLGLSLAALVATALGSAWWLSREYDALDRSAAERMIRGGLADFEASLGITLADYAVWTASYDAARAWDEPWLAENIGSGVYDGEGEIADLFIIAEPGGREFGWTVDTGAEAQPGLIDPSLIVAAVESAEQEATTRYVRSGGDLWLLAVIRMAPTEGPLEATEDEAAAPEPPRMIAGLLMSPERLATIGARFLIADLALAEEQPPDDVDSVPISGPDGAPVAWAVWTPPASGAALLYTLLPPMVAALALVAFAGALVARRMLAATGTLERALRDAEAGERAKTLFLANVSHELRTPMTGVLGVADLLRRRVEEAESRRMIDILAASARHQLALITDILELARVEGQVRRLARETFDPAEELATVVGMLATEADAKGLRLVQEAPPFGLLAKGDALAFRQIGVNLIGNAVKFTESGHVRVSLAASPTQGGISLRLEVADTGPGVPHEARSRIFRSFVRGDEKVSAGIGGVGLGLTIARGLVEMMAGTVDVSDAPEGGALFSVRMTLPAARPEGEAQAA